MYQTGDAMRTFASERAAQKHADHLNGDSAEANYGVRPIAAAITREMR